MGRPKACPRAGLLALVWTAAALGAPKVAPAPAQEPLPDSADAYAGPTPSRVPFHASPYLPRGSWEYEILDYWIASGRIASLSPMVQPYRRTEVARAIAELDGADLGRAERGWLARLRQTYAKELAALVDGAGVRGVEFAAELGAGGQLASQTHRDPLRPVLEGKFSNTRLMDDLRFDLDGSAGPVAGAFRMRRHGIYRNDPQFPDGRVVPEVSNVVLGELGSRVDEAYLELQTRYVRIGFGSLDRNWGLPGLDGFIRSDYSYSEEEISYRFGTDRIFLIGMVASYGDYRADTTHYVAMHRLEVRPFDDLLIAVSEATVHGGPGQKLDFKLINPVSLWQFARSDGDPLYNKVGQLDVWWRTPLGFNVYGSLLADATNERGSCCQMGGSLGFELPRLIPGWLVRGSVTAVQSLAYVPSNPNVPWEEYSVERIGLGWDKTDLYLISLQAEWFPGPGLWLAPKLDVQLRGAHDFRDGRPPFETLPTWPRILVGDAETTFRPALAGRWRAGWTFPLELRWDVGVNFIQDYGNEAGDDRTEFVGSVAALLRTPRWTFGLD